MDNVRRAEIVTDIVADIVAVTVFPDRARLTRAGRVTLEAGLHQLEFTDLPLALLPDSVRASGRGTARAKLLGVSTRLEHYRETPAAAVRELEEQLQAATDAGAELAARQAALSKEQANLESLGAQSEMFARGLVLRNQRPEEQGAIFDFLRERLARLRAETLALAREKRENDKRIDQLKRRLEQLHAAQPKQRYVAVVEVEVTAPGDLTVELVYMVQGAHWRPLYDLRLSDGALEVTYLAEVRQTTGEDWRNVPLTLSTAQPALALTVPELQPWYVMPRPPRPPAPASLRAAAKVTLAGAEMAAAMPTAAPMLAEPQAEYDVVAEAANVSEAGAALTYQLAGRADVPGNGDPRKVTIAGFPLKPKLDYVTAPKLQAACFRRALVKNESAYSLLPGQAQLFEGDDYLGATTLEFVAPQQEFELFLGADERMRVERELTLRDVDKNLLGDKRRIRYGYTLTLDNLRGAPQTVIVRDQLPVPRDEQIKVRLDSADPRPTTHDDLNLLEWKLEAQPGKTQVKFEFTVEHPRAMEVLGLV
jgi:uncharacterized protein (TIGR02231 family)